MIDAERIKVVAERVREFLEPRWSKIRNDECRTGDENLPLSWHQCRRSSAFLKSVLENEFPDIVWLIEGGQPSDEGMDDEADRVGGFFDGLEWKGHYWIVDADFDWLIDITADQFGGAPIIVDDQLAPNHRANFTAAEVAEHIRDVRWRVDEWMADWRSEREVSHPSISI